MATKMVADLVAGDTVVVTTSRVVKAAWTNQAGTTRVVVYVDDSTEEFDLDGSPAVTVQDVAPGV